MHGRRKCTISARGEAQAAVAVGMMVGAAMVTVAAAEPHPAQVQGIELASVLAQVRHRVRT